MKYLLLFFLIIPFYAQSEERSLSEDQNISLLIEAQEKSLEELRGLQTTLKAFRAQEAVCISHESPDALYKLSECAYKLLKSVKECHVEEYFRPSFLEELEHIGKAYESKTLPPIMAE